VISTVVIPTLNRQDQAIRALSSFQLEARRTGRELKFLILDQTLERSDYPGCRVLRSEDVNASIDLLVRKGFERDVLEFGLKGPYGGTRNVALLATAGQHVLSTDDDTLAEFRAPDGQKLESVRHGLEFTAKQRWFADRAEWRVQPASDVDFYAQHESMLGGKSNDGYEFRVLASGVIGDAGADTNSSMYLQDGIAREEFLARYDELKTTREMLQAVPEWYFTRVPFLRTFNFSFDNTRVLPPFLPAGRGENAIFAKLLLLTEPKTCIGHMPWAVAHVPTNSRSYVSDITIPEHSPLISYAIESSGCKDLHGIGKALRDVGTVPVSDMQGLLTEFQTTVGSVLVSGYEATLKKYEHKPDNWADGVNGILAQLRNRAPVTVEFATEFQRVSVLFGKLLQCWSELYEKSSVVFRT